MKWLKLHADYDDTHPWEALEIICTIMGHNPSKPLINMLSSSVRKSYDYMALIQDLCMESKGPDASRSPAELMENFALKRAA